MSIETGRDQDQLGTKTISSRSHNLPENGLIRLKASASRQGNIDSRPFALPFSTLFRQAGTRIKGSLMHREVQYTRIVVKHLLRAIAMMHIIVNDHNTLKATVI